MLYMNFLVHMKNVRQHTCSYIDARESSATKRLLLHEVEFSHDNYGTFVPTLSIANVISLREFEVSRSGWVATATEQDID